MRAGYGRSLFGSLLPLILGRDVSGEVAAVGASVQTFKIGQEVFGALHPTAVRGTYADYAILAEDQLTQKPTTLSHVVCAVVLDIIIYIIIHIILCNFVDTAGSKCNSFCSTNSMARS